ncbi:MAG: rhomboid family intramembrane serine protease [Anaerolineae bacterium]|nr:rhomboid family intramembrane serine protease [Anaerolineae bacterium]
MFPLGDASRRTLSLPVVTLGIIAINIFVFILELMNGDAFIAQWSLVPANVSVGRDWITLLTTLFVHGGWLQLIGNVAFLWIFGPQIEDLLGAAQFLVFYLLGGLAATLVQIALDPLSYSVELGASGAVAAILGAFTITYPNDRIRALMLSYPSNRVVLIPAIFLVGIWFLLQVFNELGAITMLDVANGSIAYAAHIGGFLFGLVAVRLFETSKQRARHGLS